MIRVNVMDEVFNQAYNNACRALPVEPMESPRQYGERWREAYKCKVEPNSEWPSTYYVFDNNEDYVMFMLRWA